MARRWAAVIVNRGLPGTQAQVRCHYADTVDEWSGPTTEDVIRSRVDFYRQNRCKHVMFFRDGEDASRDAVNRYIAEIEGQVQAHEEFNMTTQCITRRTVERVLGGDEALLNLVVQDLLAYF